MSWWPHSDPATLSYLAALELAAATCKLQFAPCGAGRLEVSVFALPGWDALATYPRPGGAGDRGEYPAYTRVAHGKVAVTDRRANVGTSNWEWGYMYETAGASFNTDDAQLVAPLRAAFDRDWNSTYAVPLDAFIQTEGPNACRGRSKSSDRGPSDTEVCEGVLSSLLRARPAL